MEIVLHDVVDAAALEALFKVGAIKTCPIHHEIMMRTGDPEAESRAYARATVMLTTGGVIFLRGSLLTAILRALSFTVQGECPKCARLKDT